MALFAKATGSRTRLPSRTTLLAGLLVLPLSALAHEAFQPVGTDLAHATGVRPSESDCQR